MAPRVSRTRSRTRRVVASQLACRRDHHPVERHGDAVLTEFLFQDFPLGFREGHDAGQLRLGTSA